MTTYTITETQRKVLLDMGKFAYNACHSDFVMDEKIMPAMALLESLQPNTQKPVAWGMEKNGLMLDIICPEEHEAHEGGYTVPLYTHPAPQQPLELTNDDLWAVWDDYYSDIASYDRQSFDVAFLRAVLKAAHGVKP